MIFRTTPKKYDDVTTLGDDDLICYCIGIDKKRIVDAVKAGATTLKAVKEQTRACTGDHCKEVNPNGRCCSKEIRQIIEIYSRTTEEQ